MLDLAFAFIPFQYLSGPPGATPRRRHSIVVAESLIREREAYYDSLGFMIALLCRPRAWTGYWRYRELLPG
jgi:hypothetical protein